MNKTRYAKALIVLLGFILCCPFYIIGQTTSLTLTGDYTKPGDQLYEARDWVKLDAGFSYSGGLHSTLTIQTEESLICAPEYLNGSNILNPATRTLNTACEVGSTPGTVNVLESGAATYSIPLYVAPGTAGMQPSLAINYNSNGGQGILGKGWSLANISAIYRVASSYYYDGSVNPVDFENDDAFTLDGSRLILNGSVYKSELEDYSNIVPTYNGEAITKFTVTSKNGTTIEYGSTAASKLSTTVSLETRYFAWYISKVTDAYGNYMEYTYENDTDYGIRITKITYTGNSAASITPYNTIYFYYEERDDDISSYFYGQYGTEIKNNLLLRKIRSEAGGVTARSYNFNYIQRHDESFLAEISETGSDGSSFNPTVFSYYDYSAYNFTPDYEEVLSTSSLSLEKYGDFNGDGRADLFAMNGNYLKVYTMNSSGTSFGLAYSGIVGFASNIEVGDFNGDNKADVVVCTSTTSGKILKLYKSTGSQLSYVSGADKTLVSVSELKAGDVNGDFIDDLLVSTNSPTNNAFIYYGDVSAPFSVGNDINFTLDWGNVYLKDIDGDLKNELCNIKDNKLSIYQVTSSAVSLFYTYNNGSVSTDIALGDFNGDGKTDFVYRYYSGSVENTKLAISNGKNFNTINLSSLASGVFFAFDTNNDGYDELLVYNPSSVPISPVDGTFAPELQGYSSYRFTGDDFSYNGGTALNVNENIYDFNGDGINDHIFFFDDSYWISYKYKGGEEGRLYQVADGLNNLTTIEYSPLNDSRVHLSSSTNATYPYVGFRGAKYVVSTLQESDGIGGYFETSYTYEGAQQYKPLGMFIGFSAINRTNAETGITTRKEKNYHNTYPYATTIENLTYKGTSILSGTNISSSIMNYTITPIANNRLKRNPSTSETYNYLDEVGTQTQFAFDTYGNITLKETQIGSSGTSTTFYENYTTVAGGTAPNVPQTIRTVKQRDGKASFENEVTLNYNSTNGFVNYKIIGTNKPNPLRIDYTMDALGLGLVASEKVSGSDITNRETLYEWDSHGRYIVKVTSPEGQETGYACDPFTGKVLTAELPTGYIDENTYDGFGRLTFNKSSDQSIALNWSNGQVNNCVYYAHITGNGTPEQYTYYDGLGRVLRNETQAYEASKTIVAQKGYNNKGLLDWTSAPFFDGDTEYKTDYTYDNYGRIREENYASNTQRTTYSYGVKQVTITNETAAQTVVKKFDEYGSVISVKDSYNSELKYEYSSSGGVDKVTTLDGDVTTLYDTYGRPQQVIDPDLGITSYTYYVTGELKTQTRYGQTTTYTYNRNGQVQSVTLPEGTTSYTYDGTTGQLNTIDGLNNNDVSFMYDPMGRMKSKTETIDGTDYEFGYTYKSGEPNRLASMTYPGDLS
ncbi:MAG: SpvB/TcaC N-terminal domain-containing protein [Salinivirgaceae bacterium]